MPRAALKFTYLSRYRSGLLKVCYRAGNHVISLDLYKYSKLED